MIFEQLRIKEIHPALRQRLTKKTRDERAALSAPDRAIPPCPLASGRTGGVDAAPTASAQVDKE
ncbi:MAG: hypothetical protein OHK0029_26830 [Armatimonadaceae bacterium]